MIWGNGSEATLDQVKAHVGKGWGDLIERLIADLTKLGWDGKIAQVKEKFGGLRFYIYNTLRDAQHIHDRISEAEAESFRTCENCGKPGRPKVTKFMWTKTLCDTCDSVFYEEA